MLKLVGSDLTRSCVAQCHRSLKNSLVARTLTYDKLAVRMRLLEAFWQRGYAQTSLRALEASSGLDRRQLYNGHGDKRGMFLAALDDFAEVGGRRFLAPLEAPSAGLADIAHLLKTFVALAATQEGARGCLICSTSQEEVAGDEAVRRRLEAYFDRIEAAHRNALTRAVRRGEVALDEAGIASATARLFATHVSLCVLGRAGQPAERLDAIAEQALETLR